MRKLDKQDKMGLWFFCAAVVAAIFAVLGWADKDEAEAKINEPQLEHNAAHMATCLKVARRICRQELQPVNSLYDISEETVLQVALKLYDDTPNERR